MAEVFFGGGGGSCRCILRWISWERHRLQKIF